MVSINKIQSNIAFRGQIIDAHTHVGRLYTENEHVDFTEKDILELVNKKLNVSINGKNDIDEVKYVITSNADCLNLQNGVPYVNEFDGNKKMLEIAQRNKMIKPLAVCQPSYGDAQNIEKLLIENPNQFVGLKFHPQMLPLQADSEKYDAYLKIAEKYNLPCLFHSDTISSASDPKFIYELGKRHPKVPIILGHLGLSGAANHENAISVLKESIKNGDAKLYADFAWTDVEYIKKAISELKNLPRGDFSNRLLFGTDAPLGEFNDPNRKVYDYYPNRISQIKSMIESNFKDDAKVITDKIFYQNSADLFNLDAKTVTQGASNVEVSSKNKVVEKAVKKGGKHTIAVIIGLCLLGVGAAVVAKVLNKNHKKQLQQVGTNNLQGDKLSTLG